MLYFQLHKWVQTVPSNMEWFYGNTGVDNHGKWEVDMDSSGL